MSLDTAIQHLLAANRVSGKKQAYATDNPNEWALVKAYLAGGARPSGVTSQMGVGLVELEDERRVVIPPDPEPEPQPTFAKYASPSGSDSNPGTVAAPYQTFRKLANSLTAGQSGALRAGTYGTAGTYQPITAGGAPGSPVTITNYPGEAVTVKGYIDVTASHVTIRNLHIDGSNAELTGAPPVKCGTQALGITPKGTGITFEYCEIYQSGMKGSGFVTSGNGLVIRYCKIHDIGYCHAYDHGVYLGDGDSVQIYGNWIWNNSHGWGIQVYPSPTNGRFYANVIDACGSGFVFCDEGSPTCTGNQAYNNVIVNSVGLTSDTGLVFKGAGTSPVPLEPGTNNVFRDNCCFNNPGGVGTCPNLTITGNITSDPLFVDAAAHDYRLKPGSPCAGYGLPTFVPGPTV